ncbi:hypothetical protein [Parasitella parasitica]|uniref:Reverse transcriptase domain-containing protein n=1 Tax=Parasitella parasitica TaxID=35722 RepID=A0A0B7NGK0_9FUNG|nr:hypothetical protein [Parasitella parasitica]
MFQNLGIVWIKLTRAVLRWARLQGIKLSVYLGDYILTASSARQATQQVQLVLDKRESLGLIVNLAKSHLTPSREILHLGFTINSQHMRLSVPTTKLRDLWREASRLLHQATMPLRTLASFIGAVQPARLNTRYLLQAKNCALCLSRRSEDRVTLVDNASPILKWAVLPPRAASPSPGVARRFLELLTIQQVIHIPALQGKVLRIYCDNTTAIAYVKHFGGMRSSALMDLATSIWWHCFATGTRLLLTYIPSALNPADQPSRDQERQLEWAVSSLAFPRPDVGSSLGRLLNLEPQPQASSVHLLDMGSAGSRDKRPGLELASTGPPLPLPLLESASARNTEVQLEKCPRVLIAPQLAQRYLAFSSAKFGNRTSPHPLPVGHRYSKRRRVAPYNEQAVEPSSLKDRRLSKHRRVEGLFPDLSIPDLTRKLCWLLAIFGFLRPLEIHRIGNDQSAIFGEKLRLAAMTFKEKRCGAPYVKSVIICPHPNAALCLLLTYRVYCLFSVNHLVRDIRNAALSVGAKRISHHVKSLMQYLSINGRPWAKQPLPKARARGPTTADDAVRQDAWSSRQVFDAFYRLSLRSVVDLTSLTLNISA